MSPAGCATRRAAGDTAAQTCAAIRVDSGSAKTKETLILPSLTGMAGQRAELGGKCGVDVGSAESTKAEFVGKASDRTEM